MTGRVIIMGSGETAPPLVATHRAGIGAASAGEVTVLDTPFGFQENVEQLTARLVDFFATSLQVPSVVAPLQSPQATVVERERMLAAVRRARYVFAGPGSPSYALRVWRDIAIAATLEHVVRSGGTVTFASAAALTLGAKTIPVYEIYKVGEAPHWLAGLDLMGRLGVPAVVVPHWNNAEGGNHDTSRCYIGERRFDELTAQLDIGIIGVDEHSAAVLDFAAGTLSAAGVGGVVLRCNGETRLESGDQMSLAEAVRIVGSSRPGPAAAPQRPSAPRVSLASALAARNADTAAEAVLEAEDLAAHQPEARAALRSMIVELAEAARRGLVDPRDRIGHLVDAILELRSSARERGDYAQADAIRDRLSAAGIDVRDTPSGAEWEIRPSEDVGVLGL
jgi:hypothetical protein